jgi:hypothetical protein
LKEVVMETPDGSGSQLLKVSITKGVASFRVPTLKVYSLTRLTFTMPRS